MQIIKMQIIKIINNKIRIFKIHQISKMIIVMIKNKKRRKKNQEEINVKIRKILKNVWKNN